MRVSGHPQRSEEHEPHKSPLSGTTGGGLSPEEVQRKEPFTVGVGDDL